jgi:hypothetical protein
MKPIKISIIYLLNHGEYRSELELELIHKPNGTKTNAAGGSSRVCVARELKRVNIH